MDESRWPNPERFPTLTEVLQTAERTDPAVVPETFMVGEDALVADLLDSIQARIDLEFQARLREAVAPALARAVDRLLHELGPELTQMLHETAVRAVAQELARRRSGA